MSNEKGFFGKLFSQEKKCSCNYEIVEEQPQADCCSEEEKNNPAGCCSSSNCCDSSNAEDTNKNKK